MTKSILFLIFAITSYFTQGQHSDFKSFKPGFEVFELPGGVLGNSVQGIVQDSAGFLWFASQEGLHRYDGQTFITYRHNPLNNNSLLSDYCEYIFLDSKGVIWLAHYNDGGVTAFDPATETFTRYRHEANNPESLSSLSVSIIAEDHDGYIWIGGQSGIDRLDRKTGKFRHFQHDPKNPHSLSYNVVRGLYVDKAGTIWIGTGFTWDAADPDYKFGGLNKYDPKTESFTRFMHDPHDPTSLSHNQVRAIYEDSRGNFWVGTGGEGLHLMDRIKGTFTRLNSDYKHDESIGKGKINISSPKINISSPILIGGTTQEYEQHVSSIFEDTKGRIWITAVFGGLNVYDPKSNQMQHFENILPSNFLWHTFQSADGVMWIATGNGGAKVFKVKQEGKGFPFFVPGPIVGGSVVSSVVKDKNGIVWTGYYNNYAYPLIGYDRKSGKSYPIPGNSKEGLNGRQVYSLLADSATGAVWVGTEKGLVRFESNVAGQRVKFQTLSNGPEDIYSVRHLYLARNGILWMFTWDDGLRRLDPGAARFIRYRPDHNDPGSISGINVNGLFEDPLGNIWVGGGSGNDVAYPFFIDRFNPNDQSAQFMHFVTKKETGAAIDMLQDDQGNIWFLINDGLEKFDPVTGNRQKFNSSNSNLLTQNLKSMSIAKNGKIWINSNARVIYELDPRTGQFQTFGKQYMVESPTDENSEVHIASDGEILIGRAGGFIAFYPDSIQLEKSTRLPDIRITDFRLLEERMVPGNNAVLKKNIWQTNAIKLNYRQNVFSFSVACFDYADPVENLLQFRLEGYDKGWRKDLREGETPSYVNVPPGDYTFRVRGANSFGTWNMDGAKLHIIISPPWWQTGWAYALYGLVLIAGLFYTNRILRNRIAEKERAKSRVRELAQAQEIEKAYHDLKATQAQLIQSEKMASLGELTAGIAHEIQNPLNFVNNFSDLNKEMLEEMKGELDKGNLQDAKSIANDVIENESKINLHGKRAESIVKGMLQHSRKSSGAKELTDINALCDEYLRLSYHGLRAKDAKFNCDYKLDLDPNLPLVNVVSQDIGRVILNIVNNAFQACSEKSGSLKTGSQEVYKPLVVVKTLSSIANKNLASLRPEASGCAIFITDNGPGIPPHIIDKIFQPFFTTKPTGQGTGLGLSLAYDMVKAHGGELKVETREGEGSIFIIQLPLS